MKSLLGLWPGVLIVIMVSVAVAELTEEESEVVDNLDMILSLEYIEQDEWDNDDVEALLESSPVDVVDTGTEEK